METITNNIKFYTKEDIHGHDVVKQCLDCKFVVFIGKSQDVERATRVVNETFDKGHNCTIF